MELIEDTWANHYEVGYVIVQMKAKQYKFDTGIKFSLAPLFTSSRPGEGHTLSCQLLFPKQL